MCHVSSGNRSNCLQATGYTIEMEFQTRSKQVKGKIENGYALEFLSREYDLLINYYTEEKLLLQLMTLKAKSRIKVGFGGVDEKLNDLIIKTSLGDFKTFKAELKKYLVILNEIK